MSQTLTLKDYALGFNTSGSLEEVIKYIRDVVADDVDVEGVEDVKQVLPLLENSDFQQAEEYLKRLDLQLFV